MLVFTVKCKPECPSPNLTLLIRNFFIFDQYKATDYVAQEEGSLEMIFTPANGGAPIKMPVFNFKNGGGVGMAMYNTDEVRNM